MFKPFSFLFFVAVMCWIGAILITTQPQARMDRACSPISVLGVAVEAGAGLVNEDVARTARAWFETGTYGCKHVVWSVFYRDAWMRAQQLQAEIEAGNRDAERDRSKGRDVAHADSPASASRSLAE